jgi:hypothetical protein
MTKTTPEEEEFHQGFLAGYFNESYELEASEEWISGYNNDFSLSIKMFHLFAHGEGLTEEEKAIRQREKMELLG